MFKGIIFVLRKFRVRFTCSYVKILISSSLSMVEIIFFLPRNWFPFILNTGKAERSLRLQLFRLHCLFYVSLDDQYLFNLIYLLVFSRDIFVS